MKQLQFILMIFCLGIFVMPKQMFMRENKMECCTKKETKNCHQGKGGQESSKSCSGGCASCSICCTQHLAAIKILLSGTKPEIFYFKKVLFFHKEPLFSSYLKEIWQPPKIS